MPQVPAELKALVEQGCYVYPASVKHKTPLMAGWQAKSTRNLKTISSWLRRTPNCAWLIDTTKSHLCVIDAEGPEKHPELDQSGYDTLERFKQSGCELPSTLTVQTQTGGVHLYYRTDQILPTTASTLGPQVDTRAYGGLVICPPSPGYKVTLDTKIAPLPAWVVAELGKAQRRGERGEDSDVVDTEGQVHTAVRYLQRAEPAIEGCGGDAHTYAVACQVKEHGISEVQCLDLMLEHFNDRCEPPWEFNELQTKVRNAYAYSQNPAGYAAPEEHFDADDGETPAGPRGRGIQAGTAADVVEAEIPARRWLLGHRLMRGHVTVTVAPGGIGKSQYAMAEALAVAANMELTDQQVHEQAPVWIYNTEDPLDELQRRVLAFAKYHQLDREVLERVYLTSGRSAPLRIVDRHRKVDRMAVESIKQFIINNQIALLVIDPFVKTHGVDENDNQAIDLVVSQMSAIAEDTQCALSVVHHSRKPKPEGREDMHSARGASSLVSAARIVSTIAGMTEDEARKTKIVQPHLASWYLRVDNAKANMSAPATKADWYRRESISLDNGDSVGIIVHVQPQEMGMYCEDAAADEKDKVTQCLQLLDAHKECEGKTLGMLARELRDKFSMWPDSNQEERNAALLAAVNEPPQSCPVGDGARYFEFVEAVPKNLADGKAKRGARWVMAKRRSVALQEPNEADVADLFG